MNDTLPAQTLTLPVLGMHCASCVNRIERALQKVVGVQSTAVSLAVESPRHHISF